MAEVYHVGMGEIVVAKHPVILTSLGLGSCLGLVIYDEIAKVAGMSHIMLPENHEGREVKKFGKYADTAVRKLIEELIALGALKSRLKAKMAGGPRCSQSRVRIQVPFWQLASATSRRPRRCLVISAYHWSLMMLAEIRGVASSFIQITGSW